MKALPSGSGLAPSFGVKVKRGYYGFGITATFLGYATF